MRALMTRRSGWSRRSLREVASARDTLSAPASVAGLDLAGGTRREVVGRAALGVERERLWERWRELHENLDSYAAPRPQQTAVVVLEPHPAEAAARRAA